LEFGARIIQEKSEGNKGDKNNSKREKEYFVKPKKVAEYLRFSG
jgi:hypothetical protein